MIIFQNEGEIDIRALTTFGLSAKDCDNPIGRFGTGLKYAIAVVLRNGGLIYIATPPLTYKFKTQPEDFRGEEKQFVYMSHDDDGQEWTRLGFTTDLGRDWEDWQAFREFYSNNIDEGGSMTHAERDFPSRDGWTTIAIDYRPFDAIFYSLEEHFIGDAELPLWENSEIAIYSGRSKNVFYRGIRVHELKKPAAFRYNLKNYLSLTEDRTAKNAWEVVWRITKNLPHCDNPDVCREIMNPDHEFERGLDYAEDFKETPSDAFAGAVVNSKRAPMAAAQIVRMALPEDATELNVVTPDQRGAKEMARAVALAVDCGLDKTGVTFVLGTGLPVSGNYDTRNDNLIFNDKILEDQDAMNLAAVMGLSQLNCSNGWRRCAELLIEHTRAEDADLESEREV